MLVPIGGAVIVPPSYCFPFFFLLGSPLLLLPVLHSSPHVPSPYYLFLVGFMPLALIMCVVTCRSTSAFVIFVFIPLPLLLEACVLLFVESFGHFYIIY